MQINPCIFSSACYNIITVKEKRKRKNVNSSFHSLQHDRIRWRPEAETVFKVPANS
jgi:hypothetical protein